MSVHLYSVGQTVFFSRGLSRFTARTAEVYTVSARLPPNGNDLQYRVKSPVERFERVVSEDQLSVPDANADAGTAEADESSAFAGVVDDPRHR